MTFGIIPFMNFVPRFILTVIIKIKTLHVGELLYRVNVEL